MNTISRSLHSKFSVARAVAVNAVATLTAIVLTVLSTQVQAEMPTKTALSNATWEKLNEQGLRAVQEKRPLDAQRYLGLALTEARKSKRNDRQLATTLNNLGLLRLQQKKYPDAVRLFKNAVEIFKQIYGVNNLDYAFVMQNLATAYWYQNDFDGAEPWLKRSLTVYEKAATSAPHELATALQKSGDFYYQQARSAEAEPMYQRALAIFEKTDGTNAPSVAGVLDKLAQFYQWQGHYKEANSYFARAVSIGGSQKSEIKSHYAELQQAEKEPNLIILRPKPGETYDDEPIFVRVEVENFELLAPDQIFGHAKSAQGHIHITLDHYPLVATASTQHMFGKSEGGRYLPVGKHTIVTELVHDTHLPITPPVSRTVVFYTRHSTAKGGKE